MWAFATVVRVIILSSMFKKAQRATTQHVRDAVTKGKTRHGEHFSVRTAALTDAASVITVVVSKKVAAKAVDRNTLKRRVRAALMHTKLPSSTTHIVYPKKTAFAIPVKIMKEELESLLKRG